MEILRNRDKLRERTSLWTRIQELIRAPVAVLYPDCATQICELSLQGREREVVSPQDISRITVEKRDMRAGVGDLTWTCYY